MNHPRSFPSLAIGAFALMVLSACDRGPSETELAAKTESERLRAELQARDSVIADLSNSFNDIEENLAMVHDREQAVIDNSSEQKIGTDQRERILRDLQLMNGLMQESRDRIAELTGKLDKSKVESGSLRKKLKGLDAEIAARDSAITLMKDHLLAKDFKIEEVNQQLSSLELEIARRQATIEQLGNELHTAWYAIGTRRELEDEGVLARTGGVLGIGRTSEVKQDVADNHFHQVDMRTTERIPLEGKKVDLVSEHPAGSYDIVQNGEELAYLQIKDADAFWRLSHYLVAEVR